MLKFFTHATVNQALTQSSRPAARTTTAAPGVVKDGLQLAASAPLAVAVARMAEIKPMKGLASLTDAQKARLNAIDAEAVTLLQQPNLDNTTIGMLHLMRTSAQGVLYLSGHQKSYGASSFKELKLAAQFAPNRMEVAQTYGRTVASFMNTNAFLRGAAELLSGISPKNDGLAAYNILRAWPNDPGCVMTRQALASKAINDKQLLAEANADAARIQQNDPNSWAIAVAALSNDKNIAKSGGSQ